MLSQGVAGTKSFNKEFSFFHAGSEAVQHETFAKMINDQFIVLVKEANCDSGIVHQIGTNCLAAYLSQANYSTGMLDGTEPKGYQCTINANFSAARLYAGTITTFASIQLSFNQWITPNPTTGTHGQIYQSKFQINGTLPISILPTTTPANWYFMITDDIITVGSNVALVSGDSHDITVDITNGHSSMKHFFTITVP